MRRLAGIAACLLAACEAEPIALRIGAPVDEPAPTIAFTLAASLEEAGFDVSIVFLEQGAAILDGLAGDHLDLALVEEPLTPSGRETALLPLYPSILHVLGPAGSAARDLASLLAGRVYAGPPGSAGHHLARALDGDLEISGMRLLDDPWTEPPDLYFVFGGLLSNDALRQLSGFELVDLARAGHADGASIVDAIALRYPNLRPTTLPADLYPTLTHDPVRTLAATTLLAARADLEEATAYRVTEQLAENLRPIRTMYPLARAISITRMDADPFVFPLHKGARRYIERERPGIVERYIDIIALATTLSLAAVSGAIGWAHRRRQVRKDRVDVHMAKVLAIRNRLRTDEPGDWRSYLDEIERDVVQLVITEHIVADTALIAFMQLCASVRVEIG